MTKSICDKCGAEVLKTCVANDFGSAHIYVYVPGSDPCRPHDARELEICKACRPALSALLLDWVKDRPPITI